MALSWKYSQWNDDVTPILVLLVNYLMSILAKCQHPNIGLNWLAIRKTSDAFKRNFDGVLNYMFNFHET